MDVLAKACPLNAAIPDEHWAESVIKFMQHRMVLLRLKFYVP